MELTIPKTFGNLNSEHSYLITTGRQIAKFYELNEGKILEHPEIETPKPDYTDHEGTRRREGRGTIYGTASDYQTQDDGRQTTFLHAFKEKIDHLADGKGIDAIYLFAPSEIIETIKNLFPKTLKDKLAFEYKGNFTKSHPTELLEKIKERNEKLEYVPASHEAAKILEETSKSTLNELGIPRK